jgi:hypothetical protein
MPRRGNAQDPLFDLARSKRTERAVDTAVRAAQQAGLLDSKLDAGITVTARVLARAIDQLVADGGDRWLLPRLTGELRDTLSRMRLDPSARGGDRDELANFLAGLAAPDPGSAEVGDPAKS